MIRINLAPEISEKNYQNSATRDALLIGVLCVAIYFGIEHHGSQFDTNLAQLETKLSEQKNTQEGMKNDFEKTKEIRAKAEVIKQRGDSIRRLGEGRKLSIILLDNLQMKHPERMWFNRIAFTNATNTLELSGYALDHSVIADYLKRLKEIGKIDASNASELKEFVPPQLLNSSLAAKDAIANEIKNEMRALEQVTLKSLQSEDVQGVTLQKFEITIKLQNG